MYSLRLMLDFGVRCRYVSRHAQSGNRQSRGESVKYRLPVVVMGAVLFAGTQPDALRAESGYNAWLRYARLEKSAAEKYQTLPANVVVVGRSTVLGAAQEELLRGVNGMLGRTLRLSKLEPQENSLVLGTLTALRGTALALHASSELRDDGFWLTTRKINGFDCLIVTGATDRGAAGKVGWAPETATSM